MAAKFALLVPGFYKIGSKSTTLGLKSNMAKPISLCRLFRRHFEKIYPRAMRTNRGWSGPTVVCDYNIAWQLRWTLNLNFFVRPCPHVSGNFFPQIFFGDAKIFPSTRSVSESFSAVHTYPIVSGNFLICSSAQFFCQRESWNEHAHNCDLGAISFAP